MKKSVKYLMGTFMLYAGIFVCSAGEIEQFISETMAERRAQNAQESVKPEAKSEVQQIVLPESKLSAKTKSLKSRSYRYDKAGRLVSVMCEACPELNESYLYDKQGNILEKRVGDKVYTFKYDTANQLASMESVEGLREYVYDMAGRLIEEKLNGKTDVKYTYGYLDKVTEVNRRGNITKFVYDGVGMLASKISSDGKVENWMWDGLALIRRGKDIHVNEPHISGGVPIVSRTPNGTQYHESDFLGTTLWSIDSKGNVVSFQNNTIFGDGTIKTNRCARFTGKPYDEDLQAFVFPCRNYDEKSARWRSADPAGYPDGINRQFYACVPTNVCDPLGLASFTISFNNVTPVDGSTYLYEIGKTPRVLTPSGGTVTITGTISESERGNVFSYRRDLIMGSGHSMDSNQLSFGNSLTQTWTLGLDYPFSFPADGSADGIKTFLASITIYQNNGRTNTSILSKSAYSSFTLQGVEK